MGDQNNLFDSREILRMKMLARNLMCLNSSIALVQLKLKRKSLQYCRMLTWRSSKQGAAIPTSDLRNRQKGDVQGRLRNRAVLQWEHMIGKWLCESGLEFAEIRRLWKLRLESKSQCHEIALRQ